MNGLLKRAYETAKANLPTLRNFQHAGRLALRAHVLGMHDHVVIAALLHDVVEDTDVTEDHLRAMLFPFESIAIVKELTNVYTVEAYPELNRMGRKAHEFGRLAKASLEARTLKLLDRIDNVRDIHEKPGATPGFARLYADEAEALLGFINVAGDLIPELVAELRYEIAVVRGRGK